MQALSFDDINALFSSDPLNPVSVKALNAAATADTLSRAATLQFSVTPGEDAGAYRLVGLSYTLPGSSEKFVQLAVAGEGRSIPAAGRTSSTSRPSTRPAPVHPRSTA